jgi:hypothetical protein
MGGTFIFGIPACQTGMNTWGRHSVGSGDRQCCRILGGGQSLCVAENYVK